MVQPRAGKGDTIEMMVRVPDWLRDRITENAKMSGRSFNSEIVQVLTDHYSTKQNDLPEDLRARIAAGEMALTVWREYRGLTKSQLAEISGVPRSLVHQIESGRRFGSLTTTKAIADALQITVDDLIQPHPTPLRSDAMNRLAALLIVLSASSALAQSSGRPADCLLFVDGVEHIRAHCTFTPLDKDGSFQIMALNGSSFAYVNVTSKGVAEGHWNGGEYANHAHWPLGRLVRKDACWVNERASVCAW